MRKGIKSKKAGEWRNSGMLSTNSDHRVGELVCGDPQEEFLEETSAVLKGPQFLKERPPSCWFWQIFPKEHDNDVRRRRAIFQITQVTTGHVTR